MAFPVIQTTAETAITTAGTTHQITLPSGLVGGDGIVILLDKGSTSATFNSLAGWNELIDVNAGNGMTVWYRQVDGTEGSTVTFTSSASTKSASIAFRISGGQDFNVRAPEISTIATGTSTAPDATTCTPTGGAKDYLWITFAGMAGEEADDDTWGNSSPTNYLPTTPYQKTAGTAGTNLGGLILAAAWTNNAASEDAGAFNVDASAAWNAYTLAIHPQPQDIPAKSISYESTMNAQQAAWFGRGPQALPKGAASMVSPANYVIPYAGNGRVVISETMPYMAAAITSVVVLSGWVYPGVAAAQPAFVNHDVPRPPVRAPRPIQRPYEDQWFRSANNQQAAYSASEPQRPQGKSAPIVRPPQPDMHIPVAVAATPDYGWSRPDQPARYQRPQVPKPPVWDYGATPITPPIVVSELIPYTVPGVSSVIMLPSSVYIPQVAAPVTYPIGLDAMPRPKAKQPALVTRIDQPGTVGVFFYMPQFDFEWSEKTRPAPMRRSLIRPDDSMFVRIGGTTPDYGWTLAPRLPIKPVTFHRHDPVQSHLFWSPVIPINDYGWTQVPQIPVIAKRQPRFNYAPAEIIIFQAQPFSYWPEARAPRRAPIRSLRVPQPDVHIASAPRFVYWSEPIIPRAALHAIRKVRPDETLVLIPPSVIGAWLDSQPVRPRHATPKPFRIPQTDWFMVIVPNASVLPTLFNTSTRALYLPYTTSIGGLPYTTWTALPYTTEQE